MPKSKPNAGKTNHNDVAGAEPTEGAAAPPEAASPPGAVEDAAGDAPGDQQSKDKKHNTGAADLEKVTDYAEEKEILSTSTDLEDAIAVIRKNCAFLKLYRTVS